jgi:hypothetical protein
MEDHQTGSDNIDEDSRGQSSGVCRITEAFFSEGMKPDDSVGSSLCANQQHHDFSVIRVLLLGNLY